MTIVPANEIASELVVAMDRVQWLSGKQPSDEALNFVHILVAPDTPLRVFLELFREDGGIHQIPSF